MSRVVRVRRSGGFAGMVRSGEVDLDSNDERVPELTRLVGAVDLAGVETQSHPDGFVYRFDLCGRSGSVAEQALTADLRRLAELVLG